MWYNKMMDKIPGHELLEVLEHWTTPKAAESIRKNGFRNGDEVGMFGSGVYFYYGYAGRKPKPFEDVIKATTEAKLYEVNLVNPSDDLLRRLGKTKAVYDWDEAIDSAADIQPGLVRDGYEGMRVVTDGVPQDIAPTGGNQILVFNPKQVCIEG